MGNVVIALAVGTFVFHIPFRGDPYLFFAVSALYVFVGISIGITLASISRNQRQAILTSFFFNLPLIQLSGAIAPLQSMPQLLQYVSYRQPVAVLHNMPPRHPAQGRRAGGDLAQCRDAGIFCRRASFAQRSPIPFPARLIVHSGNSGISGVNRVGTERQWS